jgi:2-methylcitrate dehydratase
VDTRDDTVTGGRLVTRELAEWVTQLRYEDLPAPVVEEATRAFADYLGESLFVGATKEWGQAIAAFAELDGGCRPEATIIATGAKATAARAAFANGTMALGFEYADFGRGGRPYPFAVTGPLVMSETRHKPGRDLVLGIVIAYEIIDRLAGAMMPTEAEVNAGTHTSSGFYVPAVMGTPASAAACSRVLGLDALQTTYAIGLGCAFAGGSFQGHEEGSWQRSLNGGMAGERAVTAALMGERYFKATAMGIEGVQGFAATFWGGRCKLDELLGGLGDSYAISTRWVKPYPMNLTLHAPVEALLKIVQGNDIHHEDIVEIEAAWQRVEPFLAKHKVSTVVSAQASLPFALSVAAVHRTIGVDQFTDETVADPRVQGLIPKTVVYQDSELYQKVKFSKPGRVTVRLKDGREFTEEVLYPRGNPSNPLSEEDFKAKFMDMAVRVLGQEQADLLYRSARSVETLDDVAEITPLFSPR